MRQSFHDNNTQTSGNLHFTFRETIKILPHENYPLYALNKLGLVVLNSILNSIHKSCQHQIIINNDGNKFVIAKYGNLFELRDLWLHYQISMIKLPPPLIMWEEGGGREGGAFMRLAAAASPIVYLGCVLTKLLHHYLVITQLVLS